jgi:hypothetical protein
MSFQLESLPSLILIRSHPQINSFVNRFLQIGLSLALFSVLPLDRFKSLEHLQDTLRQKERQSRLMSLVYLIPQRLTSLLPFPFKHTLVLEDLLLNKWAMESPSTVNVTSLARLANPMTHQLATHAFNLTMSSIFFKSIHAFRHALQDSQR